MESTVNNNLNTSLSKDNRYRIIFVFLVHNDEDNYCGGMFYDPSSKLMGAAGGDTLDDMINEAYESLEENVKTETFVPFDTENIKNSVVFDLVECHSIEELEIARKHQYRQTSYEDIKKIVLKVRNDENILREKNG
ncbi:hypothetical protein I4U23_017631 [Adineta vaga]|nr:hypothetical protein I4U23_017631 [Adineta vaga]